MSKRIVFIISFYLAAHFCSAQRTELGWMLGGANYLGDLAPDMAFNETHLGGSVFVRNRLSPFFSLRHSMSLARVSGHDANFEFNKFRNLSFRSNIFELASVVEFNFLPFGREILTRNFTSYVFAGLGFFRFNPRADFAGRYIELRTLGTEGQGLSGGKQYALMSVVIPFGIGMRFNVNRHWIFGAELGFRKTYTDYLDDVSKEYPDFVAAGQPLAMVFSDRSGEVTGGKYLAAAGDARGNPKNKDMYVLAGLTFAYRLTPPIQCPGFKGDPFRLR